MQSSRTSEFWAGVKDTFPLVVGAIPFGLIFGALAIKANLSAATAMGMSLFVFAGSAQFIAVNLVSHGVSVPLIIFTTFIVNLRHALYSASLAPYVKHLPQRWLVPLGFWLTDETFAVVINYYGRAGDSPYKHWYYFGSALFMYLNWNLCTLIGISAGSIIPSSLSLDFAAIVTFTGIVILSIKDRATVIAILVAGLVAVVANPLPNKFGLIVAALAGVVAGFIAETLQKEVQVEKDAKAL
jgi:4-azaleucine resistance transporter AzlC